MDLVSLEDGVLLEVLLVQKADQSAPEGLAVAATCAVLGFQHLNHHVAPGAGAAETRAPAGGDGGARD